MATVAFSCHLYFHWISLWGDSTVVDEGGMSPGEEVVECEFEMVGCHLDLMERIADEGG